jgi:hypothetical protein
MIWTQENFQRLTELFRAAGQDKWSQICSNLNIKKGFPLNIIASAKYGNKTTADEYFFKSMARYDEFRNVVVVENPWAENFRHVARYSLENNYPFPSEYIELDADVAVKILVLEYVP